MQWKDCILSKYAAALNSELKTEGLYLNFQQTSLSNSTQFGTTEV